MVVSEQEAEQEHNRIHRTITAITGAKYFVFIMPPIKKCAPTERDAPAQSESLYVAKQTNPTKEYGNERKHLLPKADSSEGFIFGLFGRDKFSGELIRKLGEAVASNGQIIYVFSEIIRYKMNVSLRCAIFGVFKL